MTGRCAVRSTTTERITPTDAYDTIDWLVKNVPQSNAGVGMIGPLTRLHRAHGAVNPHPGSRLGA